MSQAPQTFIKDSIKIIKVDGGICYEKEKELFKNVQAHIKDC